jgi:hypothetical protein
MSLDVVSRETEMKYKKLTKSASNSRDDEVQEDV